MHFGNLETCDNSACLIPSTASSVAGKMIKVRDIGDCKKSSPMTGPIIKHC